MGQKNDTFHFLRGFGGFPVEPGMGHGGEKSFKVGQKRLDGWIRKDKYFCDPERNFQDER